MVVMVWNYQNADCSLRKKYRVIYYHFRHTFVMQVKTAWLWYGVSHANKLIYIEPGQYWDGWPTVASLCSSARCSQRDEKWVADYRYRPSALRPGRQPWVWRGAIHTGRILHFAIWNVALYCSESGIFCFNKTELSECCTRSPAVAVAEGPRDAKLHPSYHPRNTYIHNYIQIYFAPKIVKTNVWVAGTGWLDGKGRLEEMEF